MSVNSFNTLYGVMTALSEFGASCLRALVFPRLPAMCRRLTKMTSAGQVSSDAPTAAVLMDKEGGFLQTSLNSSAGSTGTAAPLSHADVKSLESLKALMTVGLFIQMELLMECVCAACLNRILSLLAPSSTPSCGLAIPPEPPRHPRGLQGGLRSHGALADSSDAPDCRSTEPAPPTSGDGATAAITANGKWWRSPRCQQGPARVVKDSTYLCISCIYVYLCIV